MNEVNRIFDLVIANCKPCGNDLSKMNCEFCGNDLSKINGNLYTYPKEKRKRICFKCLRHLIKELLDCLNEKND